MFLVLLSKYWKHLLALVLILLLCYKIYDAGSVHGASVVQEAWDAETEERAKAIKAEEARVAALEKNHRTEVTRLTNELSKANAAHQVELATAAADYRERLRTSEARAAVYRRQAKGGTTDRGSLASHASRLDSALEEGRSLVRELRSTLGLRDRQIEALSRQIKADRTLLDEN